MKRESIDHYSARQIPETQVIEELNRRGFLRDNATEPPKVMPEIDETGFEALSPQQMHELRELVFRAQLYLSRPLIVDEYGNDDIKRDNWVNKMSEQYVGFKEFYQLNKLRGNSITMFYNHFNRVAEFVQKANLSSPRAARLIELNKELPDEQIEGYNQIESTPQKVMLAGELTRILQECVKLLVGAR